MSEASWFCQNVPECGLMFQWHPSIQKAVYVIGAKNIKKPLCGDTRPSRCPECRGKEVESLEG